MNVVTVAGRLTADAVVRHTPGGDVLTSYTVASDVGYGEKKHALFFRCTDWRKNGEKVAPYLLKGNPVTVSGELDLRTYEKDGQERTTLEVRVADVALQGSSGHRDEAPQQQGFRDKPRAQAAAQEDEPPLDENSDIPF